MVLYRTQEYLGYSKNDYYWNEYRLEEERVVKYKCHLQKNSEDGKNEWREEESVIESWNKNDSNIPDWLKIYLKRGNGMKEFDFSKATKSSLERLSQSQEAIDSFLKVHRNELSESQHKELRSLLNERSSALSEVMGVKVHSLFED
jgi:hypothetical protein